MNIEEIIINLKILEKIEINQKLITRDTYFNIEPQSLVPECFRRWNRQDNRNDAIKKINSIVNCGLFFLQKDTELSEKYELKKYLSSSIKGLQYLKDTYSTCNQNVSRIELIIEKIKS
tara:strand:+ start:362 stop:715 length:354 start_codon:yes stop_codon:yes gene_type:complete